MMISYRAGEPEDFPQILSLVKSLAVYEQRPEAVTNTVDQMLFEQEFFQTIVAESQPGVIVGVVIFFYDYSSYVGKSLHLEDIIVEEGYRGQRIGTELMQQAIQFAKDNDCKRIRWQVLSWNTKAKAFYKKFGAQIDERFAICSVDL